MMMTATTTAMISVSSSFIGFASRRSVLAFSSSSSSVDAAGASIIRTTTTIAARRSLSSAATGSPASSSRRGTSISCGITGCSNSSSSRTSPLPRTSSSSSSSSYSSSSTRLPSFQQQRITRNFVSSTQPLLMMAPSNKGDDTISGSKIRQSLFSGTDLQGHDIDTALECLALADGVCFDVDSTVVNEEGIDVLAEHLGKGSEVAALTKEAMEGGLPFEIALEKRLQLLQPSYQDIQNCLSATPLHLTPGVQEFIETLHEYNKHVYLVSGGFRLMIEPIAERLQIPVTNIVANTIVFDDNGRYLKFDPNEPTSHDMGKPKALQQIKDIGNYNCLVMIGDGATDAQAKPPASSFIGYGGVAVRQAVQDKADWFVTDFHPLVQVVKKYGTSKSKRE